MAEATEQTTIERSLVEGIIVPKWAKRLGAPPGTPTLALVGVVLLWLLWIGVYPWFYYMADVFVLFMVWCGLVELYLMQLVARLYVRRRYKLKIDRRAIGRRWLLLVGATVAVTALLACRVPLRLAFMTAEPTLAALIESRGVAEFGELDSDVQAGLYTISGEWTNFRQQYREHDHNLNMVVFELADGTSSGFIYCESGIDDLAYNDGNKGHLYGNWYWMKED